MYSDWIPEGIGGAILLIVLMLLLHAETKGKKLKKETNGSNKSSAREI